MINNLFTGQPQFSTTRLDARSYDQVSFCRPRTEARSQLRSVHRPGRTDRFDPLPAMILAAQEQRQLCRSRAGQCRRLPPRREYILLQGNQRIRFRCRREMMLRFTS